MLGARYLGALNNPAVKNSLMTLRFARIEGSTTDPMAPSTLYNMTQNNVGCEVTFR